MKLKKIDRKNIPHNFPVSITGLMLIYCDYYNAPMFVWGAVLMFLFIWWGLVILDIAHSEEYDLLKDLK